jgi:hypothetical protein
MIMSHLLDRFVRELLQFFPVAEDVRAEEEDESDDEESQVEAVFDADGHGPVARDGQETEGEQVLDE